MVDSINETNTKKKVMMCSSSAMVSPGVSGRVLTTTNSLAIAANIAPTGNPNRGSTSHGEMKKQRKAIAAAIASPANYLMKVLIPERFNVMV